MSLVFLKIQTTEWLHCNRCFATPDASPGKLFLLGNCSHILCKRCLLQGEPTPAKACPCCRKHGSFVEIGRNMKPDLQHFFGSPSGLAAQYMSQLRKVMDFQEQNRRRLLKFQNHKRKQLEQEVEVLKKKVKVMEDKLQKTETMALFGEGSDSGISSGFNSSLETSDFSEERFYTSTPDRTREVENTMETQERHRTPSFFRSKDAVLSPIARDSSADWSTKRSGGADSEGSFCPGREHDVEKGGF